MNLTHLFERALIENRIQFVQLFLDHDFSLEDFFDHPGKLLNLYQLEVLPMKSAKNTIIRLFFLNFF